MLARRFLWVMAGLIVLVLAAAVGYRIFQDRLMQAYFVPSAAFEAVPMPQGAAYSDPSMWIARPDIPGNPALWSPDEAPAPGEPLASLFFIHPTSYLKGTSWNAAIDDPESQQRARLFVRHQASPFNRIAEIWAPNYRQATFGAFLTSRQDAEKALDFAYRDVRDAFDAFLAQAPADRPIILAAHSQGSRHLVQLLRDRIAGTPVAQRIVAAYVVGWPVSTTADLPALGLPACERPGQSRCILSWQSFAEPADPKAVTQVYDASTGFTGAARAGSPMLCVNPLTGVRGGGAPAAANLGTLIPNPALTDGSVQPGLVAARCDAAGFLLIGENPPALPAYVLPGNNYHVFDYALFWANVRADAEARLRTHLRR